MAPVDPFPAASSEDVAEQQQPAAFEEDADADLDLSGAPAEADPADVVDQQATVSVADDDEVR